MYMFMRLHLYTYYYTVKSFYCQVVAHKEKASSRSR